MKQKALWTPGFLLHFSDSDSLFSNAKYIHNLLYKHVHQYWIQLLYVHIMIAEVSHSSRLSTCDTSVNIM